MTDLNKKQIAEISRASDASLAAKMELDAAVMAFEAACVVGHSRRMVERDTAVQEAMSRWLETTASKYEILRRAVYGI